MGGVTDTASRRRWVWPVVLTTWAVALVVAAYLSARTAPPTVREQRTVAQAQRVVDQAVAEVLLASGGAAAGAVPEILAYDLRTGCRLTSARDGQELNRVVMFTTPAGAEVSTLDRLADGLPAAYQARVRQGALRADAGEFVGLRGGVIGPGQVQVTVATGCRPPADLATAPGDVPGEADRAVDSALAALGVSEAQRRTHVAPCPGGGAARTVVADSAPLAAGQPPKAALEGLGAEREIVDRPELYGYRVGGTGVVIRIREGLLTISATTGC